MNREEVAKQLNQYAKEVYEAIRDEEDEITGARNFNPVMSEFYISRNQPAIFTAFLDMGTHVSIDMYEPLSKRLIAERTLSAVFAMSDLLEKHKEKLEEYLKPEESEDE